MGRRTKVKREPHELAPLHIRIPTWLMQEIRGEAFRENTSNQDVVTSQLVKRYPTKAREMKEPQPANA